MPAILVGRNLLKAPGIDPQEMLTTNLSEGLIPPELDVSGTPNILSQSHMKSVSFDRGQDQHTILPKCCYSHTLAQSSDHDSYDWIETGKNPLGDKLQDALRGMIERAESVLDSDQEAKLRNLVFEFVDMWRVADSRKHR